MTQASLYPSDLVTLALLFALKGVGERAFYRWLVRDCLPLFPQLPERTRLFRLFVAHQAWTDRFLAAPTVLGVADTYGIELLHPWREGRTAGQIGRRGWATIAAGALWAGSGASWRWCSTNGDSQRVGVRDRQRPRYDLSSTSSRRR